MNQNDPDFCTFTSFPYGIRALLVILQNYFSQRHLNTVRKIISRWAPSNENDTESYVQAVAHALGRDPDEKLPLDSSPVLYLSLAKAIARHENGAAARQIPTADWDEGARLAGIQS